jgi:hypothetical protein
MMFTKTKAALAAALVLGTASAALADDAQGMRQWVDFVAQSQKPQNAFAPRSYESLDRASVSASRTIRRTPKAAGPAHVSTVPCPTLEGYPDCH